MATVIYSKRAFADLERLTDFLLEIDARVAAETIDLITEAVALLERHPLIGRQLDDNLRELVISRGKSGYIALYSFEPEYDTALILAIRHQREAGLSGP
ncbi:MAG: type II toxin-antitoxin system RelE/ParE family toxin [Gammaproteobacteria bacterium]|jgi:plasmid stabilization system protein ParE|nr:type II toxin-antitoxin system RelE/ParE family toxin [Gammaproteobacteria bacterium]